MLPFINLAYILFDRYKIKIVLYSRIMTLEFQTYIDHEIAENF